MYDTIVNPVSSRQVKTTSKLGKKLLHNYEDKFDYVINPETNKIVQSGGKVGQQVLKKYKQKGVSTNVSGGGGKKKIKRSGGGVAEGEKELREAYAQRQQQEQRQAPREYTCKSIDNSTEEQNTGFKVKCKSNKCTPDDFNEFTEFIQGNKHGVQCNRENGKYEFARIENKYTLKLPEGLLLKKTIHEEWAKFKIMSKSDKDPIYFSKDNGSKKHGYLLQQLLRNSMSNSMLVSENKDQLQQYMNAISTDTTSPLLLDFWTAIQEGVEEIIKTRPKVFINKTDQKDGSFESFLKNTIHDPYVVKQAWSTFSDTTGIKDPLKCLWTEATTNKCKQTANHLIALKEFYSKILGNEMQNILLMLPHDNNSPVLAWKKKDEMFWKRIWEMLNTPTNMSIFHKYINESNKEFIQEKWKKLLDSKKNDSLSPNKCKVYLSEKNECSSTLRFYGKNDFIDDILSKNKLDKKFNTKLIGLVQKQGLLNKKFWDEIDDVVKNKQASQGEQAPGAPEAPGAPGATAPRAPGAEAPGALGATAAPEYVDVDTITSSIINNEDTQKLIINNWTENMKSILSPTCCVKGQLINPCRPNGRDLRNKFYNDIGLSKEHIEKIKNDYSFSQYFWEKVYNFLDIHYKNLLGQHMVAESEIPKLWKEFQASFGPLPNYSGQSSSNINPLECRIIDDVTRCTYNKKGINRCKENKKGIKKFINSVMKNDKITDIDILVNDILENQFLNMLFWEKIDGIIKESLNPNK